MQLKSLQQDCNEGEEVKGGLSHSPPFRGREGGGDGGL